MTGSDLPTFDSAVLQELRASVGGDDGFISELIATYRVDGAAQVDSIEAAIAAGDPAALVRPAHTMKSSSASVGAQRLSEMCRGLELDARSGLIADGEARLAALRAEWSEVGEALDRFAAGMAD